MIPVLVYVALSGCASVDQVAATSVAEPTALVAPEKAAARTPAFSANIVDDRAARQFKKDTDASSGELTAQSSQTTNAPAPLSIESARRTGTVESQILDEISGLAISRKTPGVLFALNDGGNTTQLHALSETGATLGQWTVKARNRDWEDMGSLKMNGKDYLVIGDTGDNDRVRAESTLYLVEEPSLDTPSTTILIPAETLRFRYEDGPRNVEAFAFNGTTLYLISKEPIGPDGPTPSRLYELQIPEHIDSTVLVARHTGNLPLAPTNLESRLAAAVAGVDLNHPTALDFDTASNTAYVLTYRHVIRIVKGERQSWAQAFSQPSERIYAHDLKQAEALTVMPGKSVWFTSEYLAAPIWVLPILAPS